MHAAVLFGLRVKYVLCKVLPLRMNTSRCHSPVECVPKLELEGSMLLLASWTAHRAAACESEHRELFEAINRRRVFCGRHASVRLPTQDTKGGGSVRALSPRSGGVVGMVEVQALGTSEISAARPNGPNMASESATETHLTNTACQTPRTRSMVVVFTVCWPD